MADGMTPAYDAFSQTRDTGTKERVTERRRVDTYTDPNRYQMPPSRRLLVQADAVDMTVTPTDGVLDKLATALSKVKPQLMDYFISKEVEKNKLLIQEGQKRAMAKEARDAGDEEFFTDQWREYGFNLQRSFMAGQDLGRQLEEDLKLKPPEEDFNSWYTNWYSEQEKRGNTYNNPGFEKEFNQGYSPSLSKSKTADLVNKNELRLNAEKTSTQEYINESVDELVKNGVFTMDNWLAIKNDQQLISRWENEDMDEFFYNTVARLVQDDHFVGNGLETLGIFREKRVDYKTGQEIPSLYSNPKWREKIEKLEDQVASKAEAKRAAAKARQKELKAYSNTIDTDNEKTIKAQIGYIPEIPMGKATVIIDPEYNAKAQNMELEIMGLYHEKKRELTGSTYFSEEQIDKASAKALEYALFEAGKKDYYSPGYKEYIREKTALASQRNVVLKNLITTDVGRQQLAQWYQDSSSIDPALFSEFTKEEKQILWDAGRAQRIQNLRRRDNLENANINAVEKQNKLDREQIKIRETTGK